MTQSFKIPYNRLIQLDKTSTTPVYMQIANQLSNAIQRNIIPIDTKLPGSRKLAALLQVNRNTIIAAFDELITQGWLMSHPNQGTFVQHKKNQIQTKSNAFPPTTAYPFQVDNRLDLADHQHNCNYFFTDGTPDIRLGLQEELAATFSANLKRKQHVTYFDPYTKKADLAFKKQVVNYLNVTRNIQAAPANVLTTSSPTTALYLCASLLLQVGDQVAISEYGYYGSHVILQHTGAQLHPIPIRQEGIDLHALEKLCQQKPIRLLYLTVNHHYPTTQSLAVQQRVKLLQLAQQYDFILLEDDVNFDFHYNHTPPLPLVSSDRKGRVIYLSSIGKAIASDFTTGLLLAPANLIQELEKHKALLEENKNYFTTHTLTELIEEGILFRHQVKVNKIYKERRDYFCSVLTRLFGDRIQFTIPEGDLAVWLTFTYPVNLMRIRALCMLNNLYIPTTLLYQNKKLTGIRLGFAHLNLEEIDHCLTIFHQACVE
ncbi:aminotransferase-like domain-containing protein [Myroides odoratus]|uniref:aminotransferase-like domain-containing protein n=1 Tax=Myroides odoratus TaxID=256 RepID=UPI00076608FB|nr:PLP-dependent aminotransferase family protein [Myroides odoratus]